MRPFSGHLLIHWATGLSLAVSGVRPVRIRAGRRAGDDATYRAVDVCDAFTAVGSVVSRPLASPVRCFPLCEVGGCSCRPTSAGPRWTCETDLSCIPDCGPIDDACALVTSDDPD